MGDFECFMVCSTVFAFHFNPFYIVVDKRYIWLVCRYVWKGDMMVSSYYFDVSSLPSGLLPLVCRYKVFCCCGLFVELNFNGLCRMNGVLYVGGCVYDKTIGALYG